MLKYSKITVCCSSQPTMIFFAYFFYNLITFFSALLHKVKNHCFVFSLIRVNSSTYLKNAECLFFFQDQGQINEKKIEKIVAGSMSRQEVLTVKLKIMGVAELIYIFHEFVYQGRRS